uniref:Uncharacterized protein n=1 Tax=Chenopodium quinoa TaxID=63459 RepID=A0A803LJI8_CHEQI
MGDVVIRFHYWDKHVDIDVDLDRCNLMDLIMDFEDTTALDTEVRDQSNAAKAAKAAKKSEEVGSQSATSAKQAKGQKGRPSAEEVIVLTASQLPSQPVPIAMDSSVPTDPNNAKDYTDEAAADVGSSGSAAYVGSSGAAADVVTTKGKGKKIEKGVKEKKNVKFEDPYGEDVVDEVQGSISIVYGTLRNRMSPSSVVNVFKELSED